MPPCCAGPPPRVLVVEDNHDARESLCLVLAARGWEVRDAADGAEGLRLALEWRPDAVVSDIGMPGLDGWELARCLRAALGAAVRLVALSGFSRPEDYRRSLGAGFDAHLAKPAEPDDLLAVLGPARRAGGAERRPGPPPMETVPAPGLAARP
jgi:CheY-like chemotaxis protein